jgi:hypothetical protein
LNIPQEETSFWPVFKKKYRQLLFSITTDRDYLFRLSLDGLALLEESRWPADDKAVDDCQKNDQREDDCHNFIRVLHVHGIHIPSGLFSYFSRLMKFQTLRPK